jgi:hypothetical protein
MISFCRSAQAQEVYAFWKDDTLLRKKFYDQTVLKKQALIASTGKEHAKDYKEIYERQFGSIEYFWKTTRPVTSATEQAYLQSIVQKIIAANPELKLQMPALFLPATAGPTQKAWVMEPS